MVNAKSEDTLLLIGLTPKVIKLKSIYKLLIDFAQKKQMKDLSDRFNVILFQENGPIYLNDFTLDFQNIFNLMKENEKKLVRANIAGGIFVACTFIIDVFKKISDKAFRLIILTDKGSINIPDHYIPVLIDLIDKVKEMPFYIDILRVATNDPQADISYMKIAKRAGGKMLEIKNPKELAESISKLADKKINPSQVTFGKKVQTLITDENRDFYINLADDPKILVSLETCGICFKKDDRTVVECPNCGVTVHMDCWAHWAKTSNVGLPFLFRCHQCFNLIKLDKNFVDIVQTGKAPEKEYESKIDLVSYLQQLEAQSGPQVVQVADPLAVSEDLLMEDLEEGEDELFSNFEESDLGDIPIPHRELQEIPRPINPVQAPKLHPIPQKTPSATERPPQNLIEIPFLAPKHPPKEEKKKKRKDDGVKVVFCPNCSKITTNKASICPSCGYKL